MPGGACSLTPSLPGIPPAPGLTWSGERAPGPRLLDGSAPPSLVTWLLSSPTIWVKRIPVG